MPEFDKIFKWLSQNLISLLAIVAGFILLFFTLKIVINIILFLIGLFLLYFGLMKLNIPQINNYLENIILKIKLFYTRK